jgi:hypothetical protein
MSLKCIACGVYANALFPVDDWPYFDCSNKDYSIIEFYLFIVYVVFAAYLKSFRIYRLTRMIEPTGCHFQLYLKLDQISQIKLITRLDLKLAIWWFDPQFIHSFMQVNIQIIFPALMISAEAQSHSRLIKLILTLESSDLK